MEIFSILFLLVLLLVFVAIYGALKALRPYIGKRAFWGEYFLVVSYLFSILLFGFTLSDNDAPYYEAIDIVGRGYSPFAEPHLLTLALFYVSLSLRYWCFGCVPRRYLP